ncbi:MAG: hypothetical protein M3Q71_09035 [Chloroflexota bacterium]|nr:hypothetical protein [Chloroflexota bacterium]MDP9470801.1 hypothetical protein [Chloroflexota bacterium]
MVAEAKTIKVVPGSELARVLDEAAGKPVVLVKDGVRYRLTPENAPPSSTISGRPGTPEGTAPSDPWADYDPDKLWEGVQAAVGSISPEEGERMKEYIYAAREAGTRPPNRP